MSAAGNGFTEISFAWLSDLEAHNDREWFTEHRETFERYVEEPFTALLEDVTARLSGTAVPLAGGAATTFRINRDVRFSKDKSPYNVHRSGLLTPSGTKQEADGLVFVRLDPTGGLLAGGLYKPPGARLEPVRQAILDAPDRFEAVVGALAERGYALDRSEVVKTMPRGYAEHAKHPQAHHLQLKQVVVTDTLPRATWLDDTVAERVVAFAGAVAPLLTYLRSVPA